MNNNYMNRLVFLKEIQENCIKENILFDNWNVIFQVEVSKEDKISQYIPYKEITNQLYPLLIKVGIPIEEHKNIIKTLNIDTIIKEKSEFVPYDKNKDKGEPLKFPPGKVKKISRHQPIPSESVLLNTTPHRLD